MKTSTFGWMSFFFMATVMIALPASSAAEPDATTKTLIDFKDPDAIRIIPNQAAFEYSSPAGATQLNLKTSAAAQYPSVRIEPKAGPWNLEGYEFVTARIVNHEQAPLRVLLSANNPNADGRNGCSTASLALGPGEKGTVTVTLGIWHGERKPFDANNVTSVDILLDKPGRSHLFAVIDVQAARRETFDLERAKADPFFAQLAPPLGRGINLGNALEAPNEGEWGVTLEESYFQAIKEAGFDSIRLPVRWSAHAAHTAPCKIEPEFFARVDWAVEQALSRGLKVVLNVHHYSEMDERPDEHQARFIALWEQIAAHYKDRPASLWFELLNEPHDKLTAGKWNKILLEALAAVRKTNPQRTVVVGPVAWNSIQELKSLELPKDDRNLIVTVHYYGPFTFTHQGAHWLDAKSRPPAGVKWLGTEAERAAIAAELDTAALWGLKHKRPIYLGEFGAYNRADLESRVRWTKFIAEEAARRKIGSAYWEFCSGFGAYDPVRKAWIEPLRDALVPAKK
jgi:aryl-phospho-beta-D-glucosidase BglC (GH1 family)